MNRIVALFTGSLLVIASWASAELALTETAPALVFRYKVPAPRHDTAPAPPLFPDELAAGLFSGSVQKITIPSESAAILGDHEWTVQVASPGSKAPSVSLTDAQAGSLAFQLLTVGPGSIQPGEQVVITLTPAVKSSRSAEVFLPKDAAEFASLVASAPSPSRPKTLSLIQPPAPSRVRFSSTVPIRTVSTAEAGTSPRLTHHGTPVPTGGIEGSSLWFYTQRRDTVTDKQDSVFVDPSPSVPPPSMSMRPAFASLTPQGVQREQTRTARIETNGMYERSAPLPLGERFVEYRLMGGQTRITTLSTADQPTSDVVLANVRLIGLNQTNGLDPDHYAELSVSGAPTQQFSWKGRTTLDVQLESSTGTWPPAFSHNVYTVPGGPPVDAQNLDWVEFVYTALPFLNTEGYCQVTLPAATDGQPRLVTIGGFASAAVSDDVILLDITDPSQPVRIDDPNLFSIPGGTAIEFEAPASASVFYAQSKSTLPAPLPLEICETLPALPAGELQGIYVCPSELQAALAPLLAYRGAGFILLDPEAAYIAFNGGQESPGAIRDAIRHLFDSAPSRAPLPAIGLVGHATFDPRDYLGLQSTPQVPTWLEESVDTGFTIENCVDYPYACLYGDDDIPDAAVGRIPARSAAELSPVVTRIIARDSAADALNDSLLPALFVYDDDEAMIVDASIWPGYWSATRRGHDIIQLALTSDGTAERAEIKTRIEEGRALVLYIGHGNNTTWADERMLRAIDVPNIDTTGTWPFVAVYSCLNGYYAYPGGDPSMAETWVLQPLFGATAMISASGADFYLPQKHLAESMMSLIAEENSTKPSTFGELLARTQITHALAYPGDAQTRHIYLLFGDPAASLIMATDTTTVPDWQSFWVIR